MGFLDGIRNVDLEKLEKNHNINGILKILKNGDENTRCDAARILWATERS